MEENSKLINSYSQQIALNTSCKLLIIVAQVPSWCSLNVPSKQNVSIIKIAQAAYTRNGCPSHDYGWYGYGFGWSDGFTDGWTDGYGYWYGYWGPNHGWRLNGWYEYGITFGWFYAKLSTIAYGWILAFLLEAIIIGCSIIILIIITIITIIINTYPL